MPVAGPAVLRLLFLLVRWHDGDQNRDGEVVGSGGNVTWQGIVKSVTDDASMVYNQQFLSHTRLHKVLSL